MRGRHAAAINQYSQIDVHTAVQNASPHRLIEMLLDGALGRLVTADGNMQRGEIAAKGENIGFAISIIEGLRGSLNQQAGGDIAGNLDQLYQYMTRRLVEANLRDDRGMLREVHGLLTQVRGGWAGIRDTPAAQAGAY